MRDHASLFPDLLRSACLIPFRLQMYAVFAGGYLPNFNFVYLRIYFGRRRRPIFTTTRIRLKGCVWGGGEEEEKEEG